ncbi:MAG: PLP-dependent aminotransferase family protein [Clostridia bacterium]|nr:PLP-dependent aminotransferase family protein [Clostridia bacterium]MBR4662207.1 PLP-dependent aminotransferase family protein [Clostridia bacterium]
MNYNFSDKIAGMKPSAIREIFKSLADPSIISFAAGNPSPLSFPTEAIEKIAGEILAEQAVAALQYSVTEGYGPLREDVKARLRDKFGIDAAGDETIITAGGQQGIELACKVLCNEGDAVICEEPTFIGALNAFRSNGAKPIGVPLRDSGIDPEALDRALREHPEAKMIYLIPTFHNPAGITSTLENRKAVLKVARAHGVPIFEDNPYGELRFSGEDVDTIKKLDGDEGGVIYCSTFSKILSAGMRVGYVTAPAPIISKMVIAKQVEDVHTNIFFQILCHRFIDEYDLDAHIAGIRKLYRDKCGLMLRSLEENLAPDVPFTRPDGGLFIWCTLPDRFDGAEFVRDALKRGVAVVPGATFCCDEGAKSNSFRLNYSTPSDEDIVKGVKILGELTREK